MNQISRVLIASFVALNIAGTALPAATPKEKPAPNTTQPATTEHRFRGAITALDTKAGTLKVQSRNDEKTFVIGEKAKSAFNRVKVGDRVRLVYADESGKLVIRSLTESKRGSEKSNK